MFQLSVQDIHPGEKAGDKEEAIRQVAAALVQAGNVAEGYVNGMLAREQQTSTFLGNGIAIPHGTTDTRDLLTLQALNAARLKEAGAVDATFVTKAINEQPLNLGQGIWLSDSAKGNLRSAIAVSRAANAFDVDGETAAMLVSVAMNDDQPIAVLKRLADLLLDNKADRLLKADAATLLALLTSDDAPTDDVLSAEFVVRNEHGLHARPGTMLVNTIKQFNSDITVTNLDGTGKPANGRSLMKVVALGVKKGHRLRFTAQGADAEQALKAIGDAIAAGLGEGA